MSKKSILDAATLSYISNMAKGVISDTDKDMSEDEVISKTELLVSNFDADLRINSDTDASNFLNESFETKQEDNSTKNDQFVYLIFQKRN